MSSGPLIHRKIILPLGKMGLVVIQPGAEVRVFWDMKWLPVKSDLFNEVYSWMGRLIAGKPRTLMPPMQCYFKEIPSEDQVVELLDPRSGYFFVLERPVHNHGDHVYLGFVWSSQDAEFR